MSSVYKAYDPAHRRHVAIKVLPPGLAAIPHFTERFRREARVLMQLDHPFVVPIVGIQEDRDLAYLVMPYFPAGSLADKLESERLTLAETGRVIHQIASALDYAHRQAVVHRDVKPSNILLDETGNALLSDFGLALITDASASVTGSALLGTPAYLSPELAQSNKVDARSDQYSLGIILFELVTGRLPFLDKTPMAIVLKHVSQPLPSPRSLAPDLPDGVERVILKATAKKPEERYPSVAELNGELQAVLAGTDGARLFARPPLRPPPPADLTVDPGPNGNLRPRFRAKLSPKTGLGVLIGVALAVVLGISVLSGGADPAAAPTTTPEVNMGVALARPSPTPTDRRSTVVSSATAEPNTVDYSTYLEGEAPSRLEVPPTPTPLPVLEGEDLRAVLDLEEPDHFDYFDDDSTWFDVDRPGKAAYWFEAGYLMGRDYEPEEHYTWWSTAEKQSGNLYVEVSATNGDCIGKDAVGLAIRVDPESISGGYSLEVSCDGHWRFRRHQIGGDPLDLTPWSESPAIETGAWASNRLGIWAYMDHFAFYINGVQIDEFSDPQYPYTYGTFALYVRASRTYDLTASFDDFAFWHIRYLP